MTTEPVHAQVQPSVENNKNCFTDENIYLLVSYIDFRVSYQSQEVQSIVKTENGNDKTPLAKEIA